MLSSPGSVAAYPPLTYTPPAIYTNSGVSYRNHTEAALSLLNRLATQAYSVAPRVRVRATHSVAAIDIVARSIETIKDFNKLLNEIIPYIQSIEDLETLLDLLENDTHLAPSMVLLFDRLKNVAHQSPHIQTRLTAYLRTLAQRAEPKQLFDFFLYVYCSFELFDPRQNKPLMEAILAPEQLHSIAAYALTSDEKIENRFRVLNHLLIHIEHLAPDFLDAVYHLTKSLAPLSPINCLVIIANIIFYFERLSPDQQADCEVFLINTLPDFRNPIQHFLSHDATSTNLSTLQKLKDQLNNLPSKHRLANIIRQMISILTLSNNFSS